MHPAELESLVHRELARLPVPQAPETLVPRVLQATQASGPLPWYARPWVTWPIPMRALSMVGITVVAMSLWFVVDAVSGGVSAAVGEMSAAVSAAVSDAATLISATRVLWRVFLEPTLGYLVTLIVVLGVASGLFCAALARVLWEGSANP